MTVKSKTKGPRAPATSLSIETIVLNLSYIFKKLKVLGRYYTKMMMIHNFVYHL